MKAFIFNQEVYIRAIPSKPLFHSTMVHEVVNRGDIFAVSLATQTLTIIPGTAKVEHIDLDIAYAEPEIQLSFDFEQSLEDVKRVANELRARSKQ